MSFPDEETLIWAKKKYGGSGGGGATVLSRKKADPLPEEYGGKTRLFDKVATIDELDGSFLLLVMDTNSMFCVFSIADGSLTTDETTGAILFTTIDAIMYCKETEVDGVVYPPGIYILGGPDQFSYFDYVYFVYGF